MTNPASGQSVELTTSTGERKSDDKPDLTHIVEVLINRITESSLINNDLINLIDSVQIAIVIVGQDLRVRRFTPLAEKLLNLTPTDVGRSLADIKLNLENLPDLEPMLAEVLSTIIPQEHDVRDRQGHWYSLRIRPYRTTENKIDGAVVMLVDMDLQKRAQAYTESIVATVNEPLLVLDPELRVRTASRAFYETFQASADQTEGRVLFELGNQQWNIPELRRRLDEILQLGNHFENFEVEREFEELGQRTMVLNARPLLQIDGPTPLILLAIHDISERKRVETELQVSETRHRRLFETAQDGILILDAASQKITHVNPFLMGLIDYPAEHFLGKELWEIGFLRDKQASLAAMLLLEKQGTIRYESLPLEDKFGNLHPVELVANVYEEGHRRVIQCNIRDISERSRLEGLLRGQAAQLSDLHRRKDEFLAMLSHELRSPLAPIANAIQLLGLQKGTETRVHQQARVIIERQIGQLEHLVDDLLEVSRITTGRVQLRRQMADVNTIVNGAIETVRPLVNQCQHELTISLQPEPIWLLADAARLEQVVVNLLTNAAKYTEQGGHLWLTVDVERNTVPDSDGNNVAPSMVVIRVRDTGVGISPTLLPHVFELFTQAERTLARSEGGLGIGLALVQRLTELHGGKVEAFSTPGHGSEFVVRIPIVASEVSSPSPPDLQTSPSTARPLRVLVVDDNADTVLSLSLLLETSGHDVRTAYDGPTGIQAALDQQPDVVFMDIGLPGLNGYEVAIRIRQEPTLSNVILVALTGYGHEMDRQSSRQAGFNHHLVKPANFEQLQEILATAATLAARI